MAYVAYNDEPPASSGVHDGSSGSAHAKGVLFGEKDGGVWLVHSVPKFPDLEAKAFEWSTSTIYGQSFMCMTLPDSDSIEQVANQLTFFHPTTFKSSIPSGLKKAYPTLQKVIDKDFVRGTSVANLSVGSGRSATTVTSFAKDPHWGKDLGEDLVSPHFKQGFLWETWRRPAMATFCAGSDHDYDSVNVLSMKFGDLEEYSYTKDHSKWGVSTDPSKALVCIGGINRMESQRKRGGGTVCMSSPSLYAAYSKSIATSELSKCGHGPGPKPPPSPSANGTCCSPHDDSCSVGQVCCKSSCTDPATCSYTKSGCHGKYGEIHYCEWTGSKCVVGENDFESAVSAKAIKIL
jgi:deoxyribonuclease-2